MTENIFPYELPENWHWVKLGTLTKNQYGYTAKAEKNNSLPKMLRITDIQNGFVDWEKVPNCKIDSNEKEKYLLKNNDIVIARTGATTGKSYIVKNPDNSVYASYLIRLQVIKSADVNFLYYFLQTDFYWNQISDLSSGIAQPGVNSTKLQNINFPLPPMDEQKKIVERIESLFSKLDEAKSIVQKILDGYELRRSAILHKAFTGELSKNFRAENNLSLDDWQEKTLGEVIKKIKYGSSAKSTYQKNNFPILRIPNIMENRIDFSDMKYLFKPDDSCQVCSNDILIVRSNGSRDLVGKCALIPEMEKNYFYASFLICISPTKSISAKFLSTYLNSNLARKQMFSKAKSSSGIHNINSKEIKSIKIFLPPLAEQKEIVRVLDSLLDKEQRTKEIAEKILQEIDLLKKSVLARAFRGEL